MVTIAISQAIIILFLLSVFLTALFYYKRPKKRKEISSIFIKIGGFIGLILYSIIFVVYQFSSQTLFINSIEETNIAVMIGTGAVIFYGLVELKKIFNGK